MRSVRIRRYPSTLELDTAARTVRYLERDWGVQVQAGKQEQLAQGLGRVDMPDFMTR